MLPLGIQNFKMTVQHTISGTFWYRQNLMTISFYLAEQLIVLVITHVLPKHVTSTKQCFATSYSIKSDLCFLAHRHNEVILHKNVKIMYVNIKNFGRSR